MTWRAAGAVLALAVFIGSACGASSGDLRADGPSSRSVASQDTRLAPGPFRLVEHEDVYLNGAENKDRPPTSFLLVGVDAAAGSVSEAEAVSRYVEAMRQDGWRIDPYRTDKDWWEFYGRRGPESVRIGPASRFAKLATADEGYARPKFRGVVKKLGEPLVVVSTDPRD